MDSADSFDGLLVPFGLTREQVDECLRIQAQGSAGAVGTLTEASADRLDALRGRPLGDVLIAQGYAAESRRAELERALEATVRGTDAGVTPVGPALAGRGVAPDAAGGMASRADPGTPRADAPTRLRSDLVATPEARAVGPPLQGAAGAHAPAPESADALPPALARYRVIRVLGRGGMGIVYLAHDRELARDVALKRLLAGEQAREEEIERFLREARAAARLAHPGIAQVYDVGVADRVHYIIMEFVPGGSLAQSIRRARPSVREAATILHAIADAVAAAHERGIVHRDLKPENVLLDADGRPKVGDFGLARVVEEESGARRTRSGSPMGTPAYMAPEQAAGDAERMGPASDVYALGAMLYELTTGRLPYPPDRPMAVLLRKLQEDPVRPRAVAPALSRDVATIIEKAMERDPSRRYPTARELADDLARWLAGEIIHARPATVAYRLGSWLRRHRGLSAGLGIACIAALAFAWALRDTGAAREREARMRRALEDAGRAVLAFEDEAFREPLEEHGRRSLAVQPAALLEALLRERPDDATVLAWRGWLRACVNDHAGARADFERARREAADVPDVWRLSGTYLLERVARERRIWITRRGGGDGFRARLAPEPEATRRDRLQGVGDLERYLTLAATAADGADDPTRPIELRLARARIALHGDRPDGPQRALEELEGLEGPRAEALRARAEGMLGGATRDPKVGWGHAHRAIWACRRGLSAWKGSPELRCDHGFALHVHETLVERDGDFTAAACTKAEAEFGETLRLAPGHLQALLGRAQARWIWARLASWRPALVEQEKGRDPESVLAQSLADAEAAAKVAGPGEPWPHAIAAEAHLAIAEEVHGFGTEDPREDFRRAVAACDRALRADPDRAEFLCTRVFARLGLARAEIKRGEDPTETLRAAAADGAVARRLDPEQAECAAAFGASMVALARQEVHDGREVPAGLEQAVAALDSALAADPGALGLRFARGSAWRLLAQRRRSARESPEDACARAEADLADLNVPEASWERILVRRLAVEAREEAGTHGHEDWWRLIQALRQVEDPYVRLGQPDFRALWLRAHVRWFECLCAGGFDPVVCFDQSKDVVPTPGTGPLFLDNRVRSLARLERGRDLLERGDPGAEGILQEAVAGLTEELEQTLDRPAVLHERGLARFACARAAKPGGIGAALPVEPAEEDLRAAIGLGRTEAWADLAELLEWAGRDDAAVAAYEAAAGALPQRAAWARERIAAIRGGK